MLQHIVHGIHYASPSWPDLTYGSPANWGPRAWGPERWVVFYFKEMYEIDGLTLCATV